MKLLGLKPFVPSGEDFPTSRQFFLDMGFTENWSSDDVCELQMGDVRFILQNYENQELQDNMMLYITVDNLDAFWHHVKDSGVLERYENARASEPTLFPWGQTEVHLIDPAGVCWHFSE